MKFCNPSLLFQPLHRVGLLQFFVAFIVILLTKHFKSILSFYVANKKKVSYFCFLKTKKYHVHSEAGSKNLALEVIRDVMSCFTVHYPLWGVELMPKLVSVGYEKSGSEEAYTDPNQTFLRVWSVKQLV